MQLIADLINPETGNTYRRDNLKKKHGIPVGSLVEIVCSGDPDNGIRLHVVRHTRDCDGEPLYSLGIWSPDPDERGDVVTIGLDDFGYPPRIKKCFNGYGEGSLRVVENSDLESRMVKGR